MNASSLLESVALARRILHEHKLFADKVDLQVLLEPNIEEELFSRLSSLELLDKDIIPWKPLWLKNGGFLQTDFPLESWHYDFLASYEYRAVELQAPACDYVADRIKAAQVLQCIDFDRILPSLDVMRHVIQVRLNNGILAIPAKYQIAQSKFEVQKIAEFK